MSVELKQIIPWGRSMREYEKMFDLTGDDLKKRILGCGDGPASFNAEMTSRGATVVSCDPIYAFKPEQILERFNDSIEPVMSQVRQHPQNYVWSYHRSPDDLLQARKTVIEHFIPDLPAGLAEHRYVVAELPALPFVDKAFDLAVCSHLLFLYSELLSFDFHLQSIRELCRVANDVRIFPLTALNCEVSLHLTPLIWELKREGFRTEVVNVNYQLQRNGNQMLRLSK